MASPLSRRRCLPRIDHLPCRALREPRALQLADQVQGHVDAGRDACRRDDASLIDEIWLSITSTFGNSLCRPSRSSQ